VVEAKEDVTVISQEKAASVTTALRKTWEVSGSKKKHWFRKRDLTDH
jgi:hypothetical protein